MTIKLIYETDRIAQVKAQLKEMNREELDFVEHLLELERQQRKNQVYNQFLSHLQQFKDKH